jgi:cell division septation protein DedD
MGWGKGRRFQFTLGKVGFVFFLFGISALLLLSFLFGILVGRNIDTYPEKIAREIPAAVTKKIAGALQGEQGPGDEKEKKPAGEGKNGETPFQYRYYETLTEKKDTLAAAEQPVPAPVRTDGPKETAKPPAVRYMVLVASLREETGAAEVRKALVSLGFRPVVDTVVLKDRGTWHRIRLTGYESFEAAKEAAAAVEKKLRGTRCIIRKEAS